MYISHIALCFDSGPLLVNIGARKIKEFKNLNILEAY